MLPIVRSHSSYQAFVVEQLQFHYSGGILCILSADWELIKKFWITDLSQTFSLLKNSYSARGPSAHDPADLLRSYLLMLQTGTTSLTKWVNDMRRILLYAILSGFSPGKTPGVSTFYDFFNRIWLSVFLIN